MRDQVGRGKLRQNEERAQTPGETKEKPLGIAVKMLDGDVVSSVPSLVGENEVSRSLKPYTEAAGEVGRGKHNLYPQKHV